MAETTEIAWCDSTLGLWIGCTQVSPACDFCYAMQYGKRFGIPWNAPPKRTADSTWAQIARYQRTAAKFIAEHGRPRRVFINSLSDFFDNQAEDSWRAAACLQFELAPDVVFILVTKRPQNVRKMVPAHWCKPGGWPANVWLLTTAENQREYDRRVAHLLVIPGPTVRGISAEPLLGEIGPSHSISFSARERAAWCSTILKRPYQPEEAASLQWVIIGGESGSKARPMPPEQSLLRMAGIFQTGGIALFVKQLSQAEHPDTFKDFATFPHNLRKRRHPNHA